MAYQIKGAVRFNSYDEAVEAAKKELKEIEGIQEADYWDDVLVNGMAVEDMWAVYEIEWRESREIVKASDGFFYMGQGEDDEKEGR